MATTKAHSDFARLMRQLFNVQQKAWRDRNLSKDTLEIYRSLDTCGGWQFVSSDPLDKLCSGKLNASVFRDSKFVMCLPPLEKDTSFVPIMTVEYHPKPEFEKSCLRIRVLMIGQNKKGFFGVGFRIESPESYCVQNPYNRDKEGNQSSIHDFYHAQLIKEIGYGPEIECPDWLPCHQPSFPLWATNPIDAILNLILTLYGRKYYKKFVTEAQPSFEMSDEFRSLNSRLL